MHLRITRGRWPIPRLASFVVLAAACTAAPATSASQVVPGGPPSSSGAPASAIASAIHASGTPSLGPAAPTATPGGQSSRTVTFIDDTSRHVLIVSTDLGARDAGHFAFQIGGTSVVSASGTLTATAAGPLSLSYDGAATLMPTASFASPRASAASSPRAVAISLRATLVPDTLQADATLIVGADRYVLATRLPSAGGVPELLDRVEAAFLADDPLALYPLMSTDITGSQTADQFATTWRTQAAAGGRRIVGLARGEVGRVEALAIGHAIVRAAYRVETRTASGTSSTASEMVLIHQATGWKLWFTAER